MAGPPKSLMMSVALMGTVATPTVAPLQEQNTQSVVAPDLFPVHAGRVITRDQLLERLNAKVRGGEVRNVDIAHALGLPSSRIPALLRGDRRIYLDEATRLIEAFALEPGQAPIPHQLLRLLARHLAARVDIPESEIEELAKDLRAFFAFASNPEVRKTVELAEGFFAALRLRRPEAEEEALSGSGPRQAH